MVQADPYLRKKCQNRHACEAPFNTPDQSASPIFTEDPDVQLDGEAFARWQCERVCKSGPICGEDDCWKDATSICGDLSKVLSTSHDIHLHREGAEGKLLCSEATRLSLRLSHTIATDH